MKKLTATIASFALAGLVVGALAGCGGGQTTPPGSGNIGETFVTAQESGKKASAKEEAFGLTFTAPKEYATVEYTCNRNPDGTVTDKNVIYRLEDTTTIDFSGALLNEGEDAVALVKENVSEEKLQNVSVDGYDFYVFELAGGQYAVAQDESQRAYGLSVESDSTEATANLKDVFDTMMNGMHIKPSNTAKVDEIDLGSVQPKINDAWKLVQIYESEKLDNLGNVVNTTRIWKFGESSDNLDFRFRIQYFPKTNIEDVLDAEKEYQDVEINGLTFKALSNDDGLIEYTVQQGEDVYSIRNMGENNSGWFTNRSEASMKAFEEFMNSLSFK